MSDQSAYNPNLINVDIINLDLILYMIPIIIIIILILQFLVFGQSAFNPHTKAYFFYLPNTDSIISILPFLLFVMLFLTAFFVTYISYQRILFYPDTNENTPFSWSNT